MSPVQFAIDLGFVFAGDAAPECCAAPAGGHADDVMRLWIAKGPTSFSGAELTVKKLYVGNLPWSVTEEELRELFGEFGSVESVAIITDRETGRSRGFAFVEIDSGEGSLRAVEELDGRDFGGRALRVNEAHDKRGGGGGRDRQ